MKKKTLNWIFGSIVCTIYASLAPRKPPKIFFFNMGWDWNCSSNFSFQTKRDKKHHKSKHNQIQCRTCMPDCNINSTALGEKKTKTTMRCSLARYEKSIQKRADDLISISKSTHISIRYNRLTRREMSGLPRLNWILFISPQNYTLFGAFVEMKHNIPFRFLCKKMPVSTLNYNLKLTSINHDRVSSSFDTRINCVSE